MHAARESTAAPPVPEKAERALLKNMQLLSEKKNVVVLPTFYECSLDIRIVASIKRIL